MIVIRLSAVQARLFLSSAALALTAAAPVLGQTALPSVGNYSLPSNAPTPIVTPVPTPPPPVIALPMPTPSPTAPAVRATPAPRATPTPRATSTPRATPTPSGTATPLSTASPLPTTTLDIATPNPAVTPSPVAPIPVATPQPDMASAERGSGWLWWLVGLGVIAVAVIAFALGRRGRAGDVRTEDAYAEPAPRPVADRLPVAPVTVPPIAKPALDIDLRPTRAGLNMMSAVVEGELSLTNASDQPMTAIRLAATLLAAHRDQDVELVAALDQPIGRPAVPAFALAPGETRTVRIVAPLARSGIRPMTAAGRPILVPLVAVGGTFAQDGVDHRIARAFVVGVERDGSAKLAPIWLDVAPRMYDTVAARVQALPAGPA